MDGFLTTWFFPANLSWVSTQFLNVAHKLAKNKLYSIPSTTQASSEAHLLSTGNMNVFPPDRDIESPPVDNGLEDYDTQVYEV